MTAVGVNNSGVGQPRRFAIGFRPDIEGLRAVAVLAVVGYHATVPIMPGGYVGVDVFFVISGFLITGLLLGEVERNGRFSLTQFYARRARRILPAAGVVLAVTSVASAVWLSPLRSQDVAHDTIAAALNVSNWRFIAEQTNYLTQGRAESPLLHYWSLSVEEQFYLVWAPLVLLLVVLAAWLKRSPIPVLAVCVAIMTTTSFLAGLHWTSTNVPLAYLGSPSRAWQFGVGALGALAVPVARGWFGRDRMLRWVAIGLGLAGALAVVWAVARFDLTTPYPGVAALLPTLGTIAVILSGVAVEGRPAGFGWLLATRPVRAIGRLSFSWYLWHWPVLILWEARFGPSTWPVKLALVGAAGGLAWLTMRLVETPVRLSPVIAARAWRGLVAGLASVVLAMAGGLYLYTNASLALEVANAPVALWNPVAPTGSSNLVGEQVDEGHLYLPPYPSIPLGPPFPSPKDARTDFPPIGTCQLPTGWPLVEPCLFGNRSSPDRIVLFGDSHAMQWYSALAEIAGRRGWAIEVLGKSGCPVAAMVIQNRNRPDADRDCATWRDRALNLIAQGPTPKMIFVGTLMEASYVGPDYLDAWDASLRRLVATGAPVAYLRDTPYPGSDIPGCVSGIPIGSSRCGFARSDSFTRDEMADLIAAGKRPGVYLVDETHSLCPHETCPAVVDGILIYRDHSHITATAARMLAPRIEYQLAQAGLLGPTATAPASTSALPGSAGR